MWPRFERQQSRFAFVTMQAIVDKDGANQQHLREAGGVTSLVALIERSAGITGRSRAAEHAAALLCRLTLYKSAHAELQESGCIGALVSFLKGDNDVIKAHAIWAVHNLTGCQLTITGCSALSDHCCALNVLQRLQPPTYVRY